jgi:plasmid stabilization system protein ParE
MVKEIIWSPLAIETYDAIIDYLLISFGDAAVKKFVQKIDDRLKLIVTRPKMFRPTNKHRNTYMTACKGKLNQTEIQAKPLCG